MRTLPEAAFNYILETPLEFADPTNNNELTSTTDLVFLAPTEKTSHIQSQLIQLFMKAAMGNGRERKTEVEPLEDNAISDEEAMRQTFGPEAVMLLFLQSDVDINKILDLTYKLLENGIAKLAGKVDMNRFHYNALSQSDRLAITGEYLSYFLAHSYLAKKLFPSLSKMKVNMLSSSTSSNPTLSHSGE